MSESAGQMLSDKQRDIVGQAVEDGEDTFSAGFAEKLGAPLAGITHHWRKMGAIDWDDEREILADNAPDDAASRSPEIPDDTTTVKSCDATQADPDSAIENDEPEPFAAPPAGEYDPFFNPFNPSGKRGTREWTPEQRAAQAERAKGRKKPPFDDDVEAVKADFDAGMSLGAIGKKWRCSDGHIRNFLTKHGIDPRRNPPGSRNGGRPLLTEEQVNTIISEKAKGTPSKEIGEMIDRSQHEVDVKYSSLKKAGLVPEDHLTSEAVEERKAAANALRAESMREYHAQRVNEQVGEDDVEDRCEMATEDGEVPEVAVPVHSQDPAPPHRLTIAHPGYAGKREDGQLVDSDWPDIKGMLAQGRERRLIASDFDIDLEELELFIASSQRREAKKPPGEAHAPLPSSTGGAS